MHKHRTQAAGLSLLLLLTAPTCLAGEEPADELAAAASGTTRPGWTRLVYTGDDLPGKPTTLLELSESTMDAVTQAGAKFSTGTSRYFTANTVHLLSVSGQANNTGTELRIWFDADTGTVLQRDRLRPGPGGSRKIYRFGPDGAARVRLEPASRTQERATPATWTQRKDKVYPYDLDAAGCSRVTVPTLLLYAVSIVQTDNPGSYLCVFQDDTLYRVWLEPQGTARIAVDYTTNSNADSHHVSGEQVVKKIVLRIEPISGKQDTTDFELLELRGEIAIYIDPANGLPVRFSGSRALYRNIGIQLTEASLAD